jgi:hypothetical protein
VPPNYRQQRGEPLSRREWRALSVVGAAVVLAGAGVGIWELATPGGGEGGRGCVSVVVPSSTGGGTITHCGAGAKSWCAAEATAHGPLAQLARSACRRADLS